MNQNNIRQHNGTIFSVAEATAWLKELDDRTKSSIGGFNSINELATLLSKLSISTEGKVGIGTTYALTQLFEIASGELDGTDCPVFRITSKDVNAVHDQLLGEIQFFNKDADGAHISAFIKNIASEGYGRRGQLSFGVSQSNSTDATEVMRINAAGRIGIGTDNPSEVLEVIGNVKCTTLIQTSDKKYKKNIEEIDGEWALNIFKKLKFSFYDFSLTNNKQAGLIAQEVEKILPQAVHTSENGDKGLNHTYIDMICKAGIQHFIKTQIQ